MTATAAPGGAGTLTVDNDGDGVSDYSLGRPDFNFKQFNANVVLRWEYLPGSTLFVVWNQGRLDSRPDGSFSVLRDVGDLFEAPANNTFMAKLSYWIG